MRTNCPNCGSSIKHLYNHQCPYCKTILDFGVETVEEINPRYMRDVELVRIEREYETNRMILVFKGKYIKFGSPLEYGKNVMVVSAECTKPKDVCWCIAINIYDFIEIFQRGKIEEFLKYLPFEIDEEEMIQSLIRYREKEFCW